MTATLADLKRRFGIDWTSLLAGWRGFGNHRRLVTLPELREFALEKLEAASDPGSDLVQLAIASDADTDEIERHLANLASRNTAEFEAAARKWVVSLLEQHLRELPSDPLYGLLGLTEFWSSLGFPAYSPHQVQARGNDVSPQDYYTEANFSKALDEHRRWIEVETRRGR